MVSVAAVKPMNATIRVMALLVIGTVAVAGACRPAAAMGVGGIVSTVATAAVATGGAAAATTAADDDDDDDDD